MAIRIYTITIDAYDPSALARFWGGVLNFRVSYESPDEVAIEPPNDQTNSCPALLFISVPEGKTVKNRLHLDLAPDDQAAEVARLTALGAKQVDIGQGKVPWVVMADPEGNEFCVLTPRP